MFFAIFKDAFCTVNRHLPILFRLFTIDFVNLVLAFNRGKSSSTAARQYTYSSAVRLESYGRQMALNFIRPPAFHDPSRLCCMPYGRAEGDSDCPDSKPMRGRRNQFAISPNVNSQCKSCINQQPIGVISRRPLAGILKCVRNRHGICRHFWGCSDNDRMEEVVYPPPVAHTGCGINSEAIPMIHF